MEAELEKEFEKQYSIDKTKAGLILCAVLVVILAISSVWLFTRVNELQDDVEYWQYVADDLNDEVYSLTTEKEDLQDEINYLTEENDYLWEEMHYARFDFYYVFPVE